MLASGVNANLARYRVLIVDDQRDVRRVLATGLTMIGLKIEVVEVPSAEEALLVALHGAFDLMISDVYLPGISGLDLVRRVKRVHPGLKFMLMTGMTDPAVRREVENAGAEAFFYKPVDMEVFLKAVEVSLGTIAVEAQPDRKKSRTEPETKPVTYKAMDDVARPELDRLEMLRQKTGAGYAALADGQGKLIAEAGQPVGKFADPDLITGLRNAVQSAAQISSHFGQPDPESILCVAGRNAYSCLASVGLEHMLFLIGSQPWQSQPNVLGKWIPEAVSDFRRMLIQPEAGSGIATLEELPEQVGEADVLEEGLLPPLDEELAHVEVSPEEQAAMDALFGMAGQQTVKGDALDAFWDNLVDESGELHKRDNSISYDEAKDMGLAPE